MESLTRFQGSTNIPIETACKKQSTLEHSFLAVFVPVWRRRDTGNAWAGSRRRRRRGSAEAEMNYNELVISGC